VTVLPRLKSTVVRRSVLAGLLSALGVAISPFLWFPLLASRAYPGQHAINAVAGVLLGPWWAALVAALTGSIRIALGVGTIYAYPGGIPGAFVVGSVAWLLRRLGFERVELAALTEPIGTVLIGGTLATYLFAPWLGHAEMAGALLVVWAGWAVSSVPGCLIGLLALEVLRRVGITREALGI